MVAEGLEAALARRNFRRHKTYRYQDAPEIKVMRKTLRGDDARKLAGRIVALRKLHIAAQGDFCSRKVLQGKEFRECMLLKPGDPQTAIMELKAFYANRYTPLEKNDSELPRAILHMHQASLQMRSSMLYPSANLASPVAQTACHTNYYNASCRQISARNLLRC